MLAILYARLPPCVRAQENMHSVQLRISKEVLTSLAKDVAEAKKHIGR